MIKIQKTWENVNFTAKKNGRQATVELSFNHENKTWNLTTEHEENVSFKDTDILISELKAEACASAIKYVKQSLATSAPKSDDYVLVPPIIISPPTLASEGTVKRKVGRPKGSTRGGRKPRILVKLGFEVGDIGIYMGEQVKVDLIEKRLIYYTKPYTGEKKRMATNVFKSRFKKS